MYISGIAGGQPFAESNRQESFNKFFVREYSVGQENQ